MTVKRTKHNEEPASYYDDVYKTSNGAYDVDRFDSIYRVVMYTLLPNSHILEVGCGTGELGRRLVMAGHKYEGFDFSFEALMKHSGCTICKVWCSNAYDKNTWANTQYDTLIAVEVFEHLDDLRILKFVPPETHVVFSVPNFSSRSHLRTYPDAESIEAYYKDVLDIHVIRRIDTQEDKAIFVCDATKLETK